MLFRPPDAESAAGCECTVTLEGLNCAGFVPFGAGLITAGDCAGALDPSDCAGGGELTAEEGDGALPRA